MNTRTLIPQDFSVVHLLRHQYMHVIPHINTRYHALTRYGQQVTLGYDTVNIINVKQVESNKKLIISSCRIFCIKNKYYYGANFPFSSMLSNCKTLNENELFYQDFAPLINQAAMKKLFIALKNTASFDIDYFSSHPLHLTPGLRNLILCLKEKTNQEFHVSEQRFVAAYMMLECETSRGIASPIFCENQVILNRLPVILNVIRIIE